MARRACSRPSRGLTLVELAVMLALLVTIGTLALPSYTDYLARHRLKAAGEALVADLSEARFAAAQRGQAMHVSFGTGAPWCWAVTTSSDCDCHVAQACRTRSVESSSMKGVELVAAEDARFEPNGQGRGMAELRSARGHLLRVEVSPLGRARLCAPQGGDPRHPAC